MVEGRAVWIRLGSIMQADGKSVQTPFYVLGLVTALLPASIRHHLSVGYGIGRLVRRTTCYVT